MPVGLSLLHLKDEHLAAVGVELDARLDRALGDVSRVALVVVEAVHRTGCIVAARADGGVFFELAQAGIGGDLENALLAGDQERRVEVAEGRVLLAALLVDE